MEGLAPGADSVLVCEDPWVGRDSGAPVTPRTPDEYLVEEVISVLAFASISKPVAGRLCIPTHLISLPEPDLTARQAPSSSPWASADCCPHGKEPLG
jgi:hypothetical protein